MGRWEPNALGRLEQAAMELYTERGFEQTTVAEIAERAGLTKRTFFRHYADKRDVLFAGAASLQERVVGAVAAAPDSRTPIAAVAEGLRAAAGLLQERQDGARYRQAIINANPELQEREIVKLATLAAAIAGALRGRGVEAKPASLAAEAGVAAFKVAFECWINADGPQDLSALVVESLTELRAVTAGESSPAVGAG